MKAYRNVKIDVECIRAINDIKDRLEKKNGNMYKISFREASRRLGESYFILKSKIKRPIIIWDI